MYTRQEASRQKQLFWTTYGQYMRPVLPAGDERVSWVNYKTHVPGIHINMDVDDKHAEIAIVLSQTDPERRGACYQQFEMLRSVLHEVLEEEWEWLPETTDEHGRATSRIGASLQGVNIYRQEDWPQIISFLKRRIMGFDAFWEMARYSFDEFR